MPTVQFYVTMSQSLEKVWHERPALDELLEYIRISKQYLLGVMLKIDPEKLDEIKDLETLEAITQMFRIWLTGNPDASHQHILDALRKKLLEEITVAENYRKYLENSRQLGSYRCIILMH